MKDVESFAGFDDCKKVLIDHHPEWDLKFVDDYYSEASQVDGFFLSLKDKLASDGDDKLSGPQGNPPCARPLRLFCLWTS